MVERDFRSPAGLVFAVAKMLVVSYAVVRVLDDYMHLCAMLHKLAGEAESDVVGVFVLMQLYAAYFADCSRVGASVSADEVEGRSCEFLAFDCYVF